MKVVAYDPFLTPERAIELGVEKVELDELLARADFITLHTPLTDQTRNILSPRESRQDQEGRAHRQLRARRADRRGGAEGSARQRPCRRRRARRVRRPSRPTTIPLFGTPSFISTPHLGASTNEAQVNVAIQVAEQMARLTWSRGGVTNALNMPSLSAEEAPRLKPYMALAEKLGSLVGQLATARIVRAISIEVEGAAAAAQPEADHRRGAGRADAGLFGHGEHGQRALPGQGARARRARGPPRPRGRLPHAGPRSRSRPPTGARSVAGTLFGNAAPRLVEHVRHRGRGRARRRR